MAGSVDDECVVVAGAVEAAGVDGGEDVGADLLGSGEVEGGGVAAAAAANEADLAGGDFDVVYFDVAGRIG